MKILFKTFLLCALLASAIPFTWAQQTESLHLSACQQLARANYPQVKQHDLIVQSREYSLSNASKGYLPQFQLLAQATYQSDVTKMPIPLPGVTVLSKDQYKVYGELNQTLYDGGNIRNQKNVQTAASEIDLSKVEVELHAIQEKVNQLYFGILLFEEQLKQTELVKSDIQAGLKRVSASVKFGTALKSNENTLHAELLKTEQKTIELKASKKAYLDMLGLFINKKLSEETILERPGNAAIANEIKRPELVLYTSMSKLYSAQEGLLNAKNLPKVNLFAQGGLGRPALNMLSNDFAFYYVGGVRLNWNFGGLYTLHKEKGILELNRKMVSVQQETFLFNTSTQILQQNAEMEKLASLLNTDTDIINLRKQIKESSSAQLENGVIQASDYIREVNAEDMARQTKLTHEIQLLLVQYSQQTTKGN
ncbi:MAG: transporter [Bacteroidetes bacterium B1(2017)]|nr:MAG: transporter [Bacteroidetes bacterium B1(2017)]